MQKESSEMWKKQDRALDTQPELAAKQIPELTPESASEMLIQKHADVKQMWEKQADAVDTQPELTSESAGGMLIHAYLHGYAEKGKVAVNPQSFFAEGQRQPSQVTMTTYTDAMNEFTKNATAFIEHLPLLTKARDAYEQAMRASAELRKVLDGGEGKLRTLRTQLEQVVNLHLVKSAPDKKKPELGKV
jgi:alpha-acetolactate decarboxylase